MDIKKLDLKKTVYELVHEFPEMVEILKELGFEGITNPMMMNTAGRVMTLPKGAAMKGMDLERVKETFRQKGFQVISQQEDWI